MGVDFEGEADEPFRRPGEPDDSEGEPDEEFEDRQGSDTEGEPDEPYGSRTNRASD